MNKNNKKNIHGAQVQTVPLFTITIKHIILREVLIQKSTSIYHETNDVKFGSL